MKKLHFRRIISAMLVVALLCATMPITAMASSPDDLVDVVVYQDDDQSIMASVPRSDLAAFEEQLKDPVYRQAQIDMARAAADPSNARVLPEGHILSQQYLGEAEIEEFVDAAGGRGTFDFLVGSGVAITAATVANLLAKVDTTGAGLAASIFVTGLMYMAAQQESWWTTSYIKILKGEISYVRYTIIENPHDYPKVWRVLDRI